MIAARFASLGCNLPPAWQPWARRGSSSVTSRPGVCSATAASYRALPAFRIVPTTLWELDPLPLLVAKRQWDPLASALTQRVQLLNLILADLYGPQNLVRAGLIPPELVFGQRGFLLPCHGVAPPRNVFLHLYAGHLVRGPEGGWSVYADYTQGPPGAGLALENRIVTSRILPIDFHSLHVERLAGFFITLRDTLQSLSVQRSDNPRVVLLSPGPRSPSYFEDAYLARYLGYTLVEGGDLTVRGTNVYLKTLGGLLPVDAILRRMHDEEADPLELRRLDLRRGRTGASCAERAGGRGQRPGQRTPGIAGADGLPAGHLPPATGRRVEVALGAHVVVRTR